MHIGSSNFQNERIKTEEHIEYDSDDSKGGSSSSSSNSSHHKVTHHDALLGHLPSYLL